ncbi:MAG: lysyl oxidase-like protein [Solirubrobacterales bacterium]|nr:lysyl oxidase-like protein [Solirubrobacterales bacterium]
MSGKTASIGGIARAAWWALGLAAALGLCLALLAPAARAAEPLLPNVVADPPNNVTLETSTTEGGLKGSGEAKLLLRFNGFIHNVGPGALDFRGSRKSTSEAMKPFQRVYNSDGTFKEEPSSAELIYVSADGHEHWHLQRAAKYSLWNGARTGEAAPAQKVGFCLDDSEHVEPTIGPKEAVYSDATGRKFCRQHEPEATSLFEGVSVGWRDLYSSNLAFQWVDASSVLPGEYWLREDVNTTGVIKEAGGANAPSYATKATVIPGFNALAQSASTPVSEARTLTLTSKAWNDSATPKYKIVTGPEHGTLSSVSGNQVTYTPASGYSGADSFTFSASDPNSPFPRNPSAATVSIEVAAGGTSKALLAGDATTAYSVSDQTTAGREEAFQFTAKSTGTIEELQFRTNSVANTGVSGLTLGIFADSAGKPGEVLGQATSSGTPATSSWIKATGLSTAVTSGTKYWLVALPLGSGKLHFNAAVGSGGTGNVESTAGGLSTLTPEAAWDTYNQGPVGFQALGTNTVNTQPSVTIEGAPASMTAGTTVQLTAHVTNDSPTVTWTASAGSITSAGLYTAPSEPPAGGTVVVTATTAKGATDQRTIEIVAPQPTVTIEGAPASMTAGTSVQLTAHVTNDSATVTWTASAGSITSGGLYTAPSEPPAGGTATVTATTAKGAHDQRTIEVIAAGTKGLLAGDATTTYPVSDQTTAGREEAFQFTAKSTGTVEELQFRTNGVANTGVTGVKLGIFADSAGKPGEVLGQATASGTPATGSWIKATGLSIAVASGTKYWLVALPLGTGKLHFNAAVGSGGAGNVESTAGGLSALTPEASWETYNQGPVGFQALGRITGAATRLATSASMRASVARARHVRTPRHRPRPRVMIEGAPSTVISGTSVQLSALLANQRPGVSWRASAGSITPNGLYTAPHAVRGRTVLITAIGRRARDRRRITIVPTPSAQAAPSAPLVGEQASAQATPGQAVARPQAIIVDGKLIMTTRLGAAGQARMSAYVGGRRLGGCVVQTPANRAFTCRLSFAGVSPYASLSVVAGLRMGGKVVQSARPTAPVQPMSMPGTAGVSWVPTAAAAGATQFICSPALRPGGRPT